MDFDFSDDAKALRETARAVLAEHAGPAATRASMNGTAAFDTALWRRVVDLGWTAARVPEALGGVGMSAEAACVLAEEAGRSLAPIPLAQTLAATEALLALGSAEQQAQWLPGIADGSVVAVTGWAEATGSPAVAAMRFAGGALTGTKSPIADLAAATLAIVSAAGPDGVGLYLVDGPNLVIVAPLSPVRR